MVYIVNKEFALRKQNFACIPVTLNLPYGKIKLGYTFRFRIEWNLLIFSKKKEKTLAFRFLSFTSMIWKSQQSAMY